MHVELTPDNKDKYLRASADLKISVGEICNRILAAVDSVEIEMAIKLTPKPNSEAEKTKPKPTFRLRPRWQVKL